MAKAAIFRAIEAQREAINRSEKALLRKMTRLWLEPYLHLNQQVQDLMKAIRAQIDRGEPVTPQYVYSLSRYREMRAQAVDIIRRYNQAAAGVISGAEADAVKIGDANAKELVNIAAAGSPMWTRVNQRETRIMSGMLSEVSPLRTLLEKSYSEYMNRIEGVLLTGMASGQGSQWIADQLSEAGQIPLKRALTIARTEVNRAYRSANLETMRESNAVIGYRRMCYPPTACFACLMMDGEFYEKNSSFSDHPNGKCSAVPVTRHFDPIDQPGWERGQEWFARQDEATQRKLMGAGRFDLWQQGKVGLRDMVYIKENPLWGGSPTMRTLEELNFGYRGKDIPASKILEASFSVRYLSKTDDLFIWSAKVEPIEGYEDIFVHGTKTAFIFTDADGIETKISAYEFADILKDTPGYHGGRIRLFSCDTGGDNALAAQALSDIMNVEIMAPSGEIFLRPDGKFRIENEDGATGDWRFYKPNGKFKNPKL